VTGEKKKDKQANLATAERLWIPAVNNAGCFGRWASIELRDPWNSATAIRELLERMSARDLVDAGTNG